MDNNNNIISSRLLMNIASNTSTPSNNLMLSGLQVNNTQMQSIKALVKHSGEVTGYELSNGEKITKERGVELAKKGLISGVSVSVSKKGEEYLRSSRDDDESNNLSSLPIINE